MNVIETILWKSLEWPGHEETAPCRPDDAITCNAGWTTRGTTVRDRIGSGEIDIAIESANGIWTMNGEEQAQGHRRSLWTAER